jgi:hypothetical protein
VDKLLKLTNLSDDPWTLSKFDNSTCKIENFLDTHGLNGLEIISCDKSGTAIIPKSRIMGNHLLFWPIWLDFWKSDKKELLRQFGDEKSYEEYYCCKSKNEFVENYRRALIEAENMGAKYVVFHVCHVQLEHCYNYKFTYSDSEVVDTFIEMLNEILDGLHIRLSVLFENHWFPGLTFLDKKQADKLMSGIHYPNKGFVLDIGHLMNTNLELSSEEEAAFYILKVLKALGDTAKNIKTIHLNSSLSGKYVKNSIKNSVYNAEDSYINRLLCSMTHVGKIDTHIPFTHPSIKKVIEYVNPDFLVYELMTNSLEELTKYVDIQNRALL